MKLPKLDLSMQKTCKPAMLGRVWQACRRGLSLEHSPPQVFGCCQWEEGYVPSLNYLMYRWIVFLMVLMIAVASFMCQRLPSYYTGPLHEVNPYKWFIYFTNWGFMLIVLESMLAALVVQRYRVEKSYSLPCEDEIPMPVSRRTRTPMLCRIYWLVQNIATDLAFVITLVYWSLVHDPELHEVNSLNLLVHAGNSVVMFFELLMTAHPMRMAHAVYGAGAGMVYGIFSAVYWAAGGTDRIDQPAIYEALNWNKPGLAFGFVAMCAVVLVCAHGLAVCIVTMRIRWARARSAQVAQTDRLTLPTH